jgi:tight adherence protein B
MLAAFLAFSGRRATHASPTRRAPGARVAGPVPLLAGAVAALAALVLLDGRELVLGGILAGAGVGAGLLLRQAGLVRSAERRSEQLVEAGEALVGELQAGQPLDAALHRAVAVWPELEPVASAGMLGADVPTAMRRLATAPGAEAMAEVAAAWQLGQGSGMGLSHSLEQVLVTTRARQETRRRVRAELASARATARLVAVLPVLSLLAAQSMGARPWRFLLGTRPGLACLAAGLLLGFAGLWWMERIAVAALRESR